MTNNPDSEISKKKIISKEPKKELISNKPVENSFHEMGEFTKKPKINLWHPKIYATILIIIIIAATVILFIKMPSSEKTAEEEYKEKKEFIITEEFIEKSAQTATDSFVEGGTSWSEVALASDSIVSGKNMCNTTPNIVLESGEKICEKKYNNFLAVENTANGTCLGLEAFLGWEDPIDNEFCRNVNSDNCIFYGEGTKLDMLCTLTKNQDLTICEQVTTFNELGYKKCREFIRLYSARKQNNTEICEGIHEIAGREACRRMVLGQENMFVDMIHAMSTASIAKNNNNLKICESIMVKSIKEMCLDKNMDFEMIKNKVKEVIV